MVSGFISCLYVSIASSFLCPTLQTRLSTWTVPVSAWSLVRLLLVVWTAGSEQLVHMSHFSDSLTALSGFGVPSSLIEHERVKQAVIGIFVSGFPGSLTL